MRHAELHNHDYFSILDGCSSPAEYMARAKEIGITHLAQTNHGTNSGHREFQREAKKAGITPILGQEAYMSNDRFDRRSNANRQDGTSIYNHLTLLAKNEAGLKNLEHLSRIGWTEGFYHKARCDFDVLDDHSEGIIALSGCMSGMVAKALEGGQQQRAKLLVNQFKAIFGDRFFIEVMESNSVELNTALMALSRSEGVLPVITSDCHMASKEDLWLAEAMLVLNTNPKFASQVDHSVLAQKDWLDKWNYLYPDRKMSFQQFQLHLHTYQEHVDNLARHGIGKEPVDNTMVVANMIEDYPYYEGLDLLPKVSQTPMEDLRAAAFAGLRARGIESPETVSRLTHELDTIAAKGLASYFLIEKDVIDYSVENDILTGYGRGSAVSYLTNYCLGITKINPMPYNLLPERFLSIDREDPADIDTDFAMSGRYEIKNYVKRKYGHVSNIATIGYYKDKSAIKAAAKALRIPFGETNQAIALIEDIDEYEATDAEATVAFRNKYPDLLPLAKALIGRIQNFGMHAGGTIIAKEPIEDYVPVQTANDPSDESAGRVLVAAVDKREAADIGFVKYDFLGLRTLSVVDDAIRMIHKRHGVKIDIENIPLDDSAIYDMISKGHTTGLFQAEASASTKTILKMGGVRNFAELVASNALVRPGAANSTVGATYMEGKRTGYIESLHPDADWFLEETYGAVLYQEQQLLLCQEIAGMSPGDANKVRKAISAKIAEDLAVWKDEFVNGAAKKLGQTKAEKVWKDLEASAKYAFAKAHAVGYSMLTLLTAYLKYYYPLEFFTAALSHINTASKTDRMKMLTYLIEAKRMGLRIKLPHVNLSGVGIEIQSDDNGDYIRFGLSAIKYISEKTAMRIKNKAPYASYADFIKAKEEKYSGINRNVINSLNAVGAAAFDDNPVSGDERKNYYAYVNIPAISYELDPRITSQFRDLKDFTEDETFVIMGIAQEVKRGGWWQRVDFVDETGTAGVFVKPGTEFEIGKLYAGLVANNSLALFAPYEKIGETPMWEFLNKDYAEVPEDALAVVSFVTRTTKAGKKMADIVFADSNKNLMTALVWPTMYPQAHTMCKPGSIVRPGLRELDGGGYAITKIERV